MIELWLTSRTEVALEIEELPVNETPGLAWGEGVPPGGRGWYLERLRERAWARGKLGLWRMSRSTAEWLEGELEWRLMRLPPGSADGECKAMRNALRASLAGVKEALEAGKKFQS